MPMRPSTHAAARGGPAPSRTGRGRPFLLILLAALAAGLILALAPAAARAAPPTVRAVAAAPAKIAAAGGQSTITVTVSPGTGAAAVTQVTLTTTLGAFGAAAGAAAASLALTLHGPPAQLELTALARRVHLGDTPFAAPPGTLVASLFDAGGRPVPRVAVRFQADAAGVTVVQHGEGESGVTGASGRAAAHVSAQDATETGTVTITAQAGELSATAAIRIVGPAARLQLVLTPRETAGAYDVAALVTDSGGAAVPSGYQVHFSAVGATPSAMPAFDPVTAETMDGLARTVFTLDGARDGVRVRAYVAAIDLDVRASAPLPERGQAASISLAEGSNLITWPGPALAASAAVAAIVDQVTAIWRFDASQGWQSYAPADARGVDFPIAPGDLLAVTTSAAVVWTVPEGAEEEDGDGDGE